MDKYPKTSRWRCVRARHPFIRIQQQPINVRAGLYSASQKTTEWWSKECDFHDSQAAHVKKKKAHWNPRHSLFATFRGTQGTFPGTAHASGIHVVGRFFLYLRLKPTIIWHFLSQQQHDRHSRSEIHTVVTQKCQAETVKISEPAVFSSYLIDFSVYP